MHEGNAISTNIFPQYKNVISEGSSALLYCEEINKGARAGRPCLLKRWELFTNTRYEQHLCHEYRAGLEAWHLIKGGMQEWETFRKLFRVGTAKHSPVHLPHYRR